jgi:hypothetical protein
VTLTVTVPTKQTSTDLTVAVPTTDDSQNVQAALSDPTKITQVSDAKLRRKLTGELHDLDAFLATRARLRPYRASLWYVAHHTRPAVTPRRVAALVWCALWFPHSCG